MYSNNALNGLKCFAGTILLGIATWFDPEHIDRTMKVLTGTGATISAILAGVYYIFAIKEKRQSIKRMKDGK